MLFESRPYTLHPSRTASRGNLSRERIPYLFIIFPNEITVFIIFGDVALLSLTELFWKTSRLSLPLMDFAPTSLFFRRERRRVLSPRFHFLQRIHMFRRLWSGFRAERRIGSRTKKHTNLPRRRES